MAQTARHALAADGIRIVLCHWVRLKRSNNNTPPSSEGIERMRAAYRRNVAVLPPGDVHAIITRGALTHRCFSSKPA